MKGSNNVLSLPIPLEKATNKGKKFPRVDSNFLEEVKRYEEEQVGSLWVFFQFIFEIESQERRGKRGFGKRKPYQNVSEMPVIVDSCEVIRTNL